MAASQRPPAASRFERRLDMGFLLFSEMADAEPLGPASTTREV
jgi:hypothetical protein